jgi:hypothetical protein
MEVKCPAVEKPASLSVIILASYELKPCTEQKIPATSRDLVNCFKNIRILLAKLPAKSMVRKIGRGNWKNS